MRRLAILLALLSSGTIAFVAPAPASANTPVVEPEPIAHIFAEQTTGPVGFPSPNSVMPWGLDRIDARSGRNNSYKYETTENGMGTGVKVFVVDTGVKSGHPVFSGRVAGGWSYRAVSVAKSNEWFNELGSCKTNSAKYTYDEYEHPYDVDAFDRTYTQSDTGGSDNNGHGTHVAGTIGGNTTGVAKGVTIVPVRVLNSCGRGGEEMVNLGLEWILQQHLASGGPSVVNMSIGFDMESPAIDNAVQNLIAAGVPVIAAAGNSATTSCNTTPAGTFGTISVGASEYDDWEAEYSNYGLCVDIFAPGSDIVSSWPMSNPTSTSVIADNSYVREWGTSMAAPHVSGAVARYLQGKTITPTTPASALSWLKLNATCNAISYFAPLNRTGLYMTPNRLLAIDAPASKPCTPASVTATAGNGNVTVRWDPVAAENGSATLRYEVTLMPGSKTCTRIPTQSLSCVFSGLESYEAYTASVIAVNSVGDGVALSSTTRRPNAVTNLAATVIANSLDVSWTKGVGDQDGVTYTVTAAPGGATCTSTATNCSITGLTVGTAYTLTVVGVNMTGTGAGTSLIKTFTRAPLAVTELVIAAADNALDISWINGSGEVAGTKYTATTTPGDFTCTSTSSTCSITSLVNGTEYSVSVVGVNVYGTGLATTAKGTPDGAPDVPLTVKSVLSKRTITLSWPAVTTTANVTYVVSSQPGDLKCTTVLTTCEVAGFSYGVDYSFTISTRSATGLTSSAALSGSARPGFKVNRTTMKRGSSMLLRGFLTPLSTGKQTWSETGPCYIRGTRLVAPKKVTKCVVVLKVTRKGSYPAMSTRLVISVK